MGYTLFSPDCEAYADAVVEMAANTDSMCIDALARLGDTQAAASCEDSVRCEWLEAQRACDGQVSVLLWDPGVSGPCSP